MGKLGEVEAAELREDKAEQKLEVPMAGVLEV